MSQKKQQVVACSVAVATALALGGLTARADQHGDQDDKDGSESALEFLRSHNRNLPRSSAEAKSAPGF